MGKGVLVWGRGGYSGGVEVGCWVSVYVGGRGKGGCVCGSGGSICIRGRGACDCSVGNEAVVLEREGVQS